MDCRALPRCRDKDLNNAGDCTSIRLFVSVEWGACQEDHESDEECDAGDPEAPGSSLIVLHSGHRQLQVSKVSPGCM